MKTAAVLRLLPTTEKEAENFQELLRLELEAGNITYDEVIEIAQFFNKIISEIITY